MKTDETITEPTETQTDKRCPECKSDDIDRCHSNGSFGLPECDYYRCDDCGHQWGHS